MPHKVPSDPLPAFGSPNVTIRPPKRAAPFSTARAEARMIRQKLLEVEQELEDRDALENHPVSNHRQYYMLALLLNKAS